MDWKQECDAEAAALTQEKRQEFLDLMWSGMRLGDAQVKCGITFKAANGVMLQNIEDGAKRLRRVAL